MRILILAAIAAASFATGSATAATFTYDFVVGDFANETTTPAATPPSVTEWAGSVTIDMDLTNIVGETGFVSAMTPFSNDTPFEFNATNTIFGKSTLNALPGQELFRIYFGGLGQSAAPSLSEAGGLGASGIDDFRVGFEVDATGSVINVLIGEQLGATYNNSNPVSAYVARKVEVSLAVQGQTGPGVVPLPASAWFLIAGAGALASTRLRMPFRKAA